ncbi:hypothetical protein IWQ47_000096 [Aquimarina sp. EL_43]|uniref:DUF4386 domain-containing protein n=1 Tax=unclassified Aquimarina TaxID=2627091 RepID=UPI0018CAFE74|nr:MULTISPECIES: DUF4386 domain-containing protein [unclassified Aquimarina]MBG6129212.1 hypothetical protein [Aquimarina sp. EL_35]MBG6150277.1 hypothetical protein [Aquimarina sp. EL_32]MBG6167038.1 hypothetical protein [Aquimarina sp. EL_43]
MNSNQKTGRIAGLLFLTIIAAGMFAEFFVRQKIFVTDDPAVTVANIANNGWLYRLGIVSDLVMILAFFFYPLVLDRVFKHVNKELSRLMVSSVMISVAILCVTMLAMIAPLLLTSGADYMEGFTTNQINGLVTFFLKLHTNGYVISQIFYGLYLFPLGYMIFKSGLAPKIIGMLLILGCIGDQIDVIRYFLFPNSESVLLENITIPADLGEMSLCLWLLIMGLRNRKVETESVA